MTTPLIAEHDNKSLKDATAKALTAATALGGNVHVLVAGKDCVAVAQHPAHAGVREKKRRTTNYIRLQLPNENWLGYLGFLRSKTAISCGSARN
jgi:electron transfer flavoprotein alpha subunit